MKTLTTREFFHSPGLMKSLRAGQSILITDKGKPALVVSKPGRRPRRSKAELEREAKAISTRRSPRVSFADALRQMKTR